jgi:hypothetical protein
VSKKEAPVPSSVQTTSNLSVGPRTTGASSQGLSTLVPRSQPLPVHSKYHYGNHYRRSNPTQSTRRPGNKKWNNPAAAPQGDHDRPRQPKPDSNRTAVLSQATSVEVREKSKPPLPPSSSSSSTSSVITSSFSKANSEGTAGVVHRKWPHRYKWPHKPSPSKLAQANPRITAPTKLTMATPPKTATALPRSHGNPAPLSRVASAGTTSSRYKWRRRSTTPSTSSGRKSQGNRSPGLKSPPGSGSRTKLQPHTPSWVIHNPYTLTHASIIHKYSRIMQRQRNSKTAKLNRFLTKRTSLQTPHKISKSKNKVWRASDHCGGRSATRTSIGRSTPLRRLSGGHELKTRHGNRQWVARRAAGSFPPTPGKSGARYAGPVPWRRLSGHELKTRHGNRQWVSRRVVMRRKTLQSPAANGCGRWMTARHEGRRGKSLQFVSMSGQKFVVDSGGRRMKRLSLSSPSSSRLRLRSRGRSVSESHTPSNSVKQYLASRAVLRSRVYVWSAKHRKKDNAKQYCIFYNRFGKCNRGDSCPYIHDPSKIAVCTKFLRGMCDKTDGSCLFSHTLSKDKLPTCRYFLRGVCTREVCPYRHVSVGRRAEVCLNFARGYCPNGEQCSKRHIVDCPEFSEQGSCPHGDKCLLRHRKKTEASATIAQSLAPPTKTKTLPTKTPLAFRRLRRDRVGPQPPEYVELDPAISPLDGGEGSGGDADYVTLCQDTRRLSPLDPSCPAPDFLAL